MSAKKAAVAEKVKEDRKPRGLGHKELGLSEDTLLHMYRIMVLSRILDERMWALQRQGKVAFHISGMGHEALQVAAAHCVQKGVDFVHPYYRDMALTLYLGVTPNELMLSLFAKKGDPLSGARQMPAHYGYRALNIVSGSSPVATQIPQAVGIALASKIRREKAVTLTCFGEGGSSKGDFHEALNFAGIYKLPVVFLCENNQYAISVHQSKQMAIENVADRAAGYGFPGAICDGNDFLDTYRVTKEAFERARRGEGPTLVEAKTYRIVPHSSDDDDRTYRSREEVEEWKRRDPILRTKQYLFEARLLDEKGDQEIRAWALKETNEANEYGEKAPYPDPSEALKNVFFEGS